MIKRLSIGLILAALLISCSTTKQTDNTYTGKNQLPKRNARPLNITLSGTVTASMNDSKQSGKFKMLIANTDSVSLSVYGPFSIIMGRLYSTPDFFMFYNTMGNELIQGSPQADKIMQAINMPISYADLVRLSRCETPGEPKLFIFADERESGILFVNDKGEKYIEYALVRDGNIVQYQRKTKDGATILNVLYSEYQMVDKYSLPEKIVFNFPQQKGNLTMEVDEYILDESYTDPFKFKVPEDAEYRKF